MGLLDKVKEAAGSAVEVGKKGAAVAKEKVGDVQLRRKADDLAKQLGYLVVAGNGSAGPEGETMIAQIKDLEAQIEASTEAAAGDAEAAGGEAEAPGE
jgi:hypothetical protein